MARTRNRSGVPGEAALDQLSSAELRAEADRVRTRLAAPVSPVLLNLLLKKQHAVQRELEKRAS